MANPYRTDPTASATAAPAIILTSRGGRRTKFLVLSLVAVFWTGLSGTMWGLAFRDGETVATLFLSLFVLAGLGMLVAAGFQFLGLFNPQVRLTIPAPLTLGGRVSIEWELTGNVARLEAFSLHLVGTEHATYRRGTDRQTDRHVFRTLDLLTLDEPARIMDGRGRADAVIPADTMHSFAARSNEVRWTLQARGPIRRWPDVNDEWTVQVRPLEPGDAGISGTIGVDADAADREAELA